MHGEVVRAPGDRAVDRALVDLFAGLRRATEEGDRILGRASVPTTCSRRSGRVQRRRDGLLLGVPGVHHLADVTADRRLRGAFFQGHDHTVRL